MQQMCSGGSAVGKQRSLFPEQASLGIDANVAPHSQIFRQGLEATEEEFRRRCALRREVDDEDGEPKQ
jgi:hypothetical protein